MKKIFALAIIAIFIFSLVPLVLAQDTRIEASSDTSASVDTTSNTETDTRTEVEVKEEIDDDTTKIKTEVRVREETKDEGTRVRTEIKKRADIKEDVRDTTNVDRARCLENCKKEGRTDCETRCKAADKKEDVRERVREKLAARGLTTAQLAVFDGLSEEDKVKLSKLSRERVKQVLATKDPEKVKKELRESKIKKVRSADDLKDRKLSKARLDELGEKFRKSKERSERLEEEVAIKLQECKRVPKENEQEALSCKKASLNKMIERITAHLEKLKSKVQENENIAEERANEVVSKIDAQIAELNSIKVEADAATTKEQLKEATKKLREEWNDIKKAAALHAERVISARVQGIVNRLLVLEKKLEAMTEEKSIDISAELSAFSQKVADAQDKKAQAEAKLEAGASTEAKALLKQAMDSVREAHRILYKDIWPKVKKVDPDAKISTEEVVEVAEQPSTESSQTTSVATTETATSEATAESTTTTESEANAESSTSESATTEASVEATAST